ncbi:ribosome-binding factor A [Microbacterium trichothecenolyticum]|uniref:Ribosome-binding factor A n=1 Tax=Microbacterium trichothecenolyticum TaxID=69370 RepID=A0ABU0TSX4_MICTR|nr:ribosome-binding factor A [Microbacterium trichothecenolyticum]
MLSEMHTPPAYAGGGILVGIFTRWVIRGGMKNEKEKDVAGERQARVADRIRVVLAERLEKGLRDPRLGFVTITDVRVTGDLQRASVFYTVMGDEAHRADTAAALKSATGMLRSEVGKHLNTRLTPSLEFILDGIPENADHISALLREARERDESVAGLAAAAAYAGDADPYVKPREHDEGDDLDEDDDRA